MSTQQIAIRATSSPRDSFRMCGSTALTYGVGLWIVSCNPYVASQITRPPIFLPELPMTLKFFVNVFLLIIGRTPFECLTRIAVIGFIIQAVKAFTISEDAQADELDIEHYRPYVFWRAIYRFLVACAPFLRGRRLDAPPSTSLSEYERITVRYLFVKLIFMPMMITIFFSNLQTLIGTLMTFHGPANFGSSSFVQHLYITGFFILMVFDVAWFATGCSMETGRFSPIKMIDPYASGWLVALICYPPLLSISAQYLVWGPPEFPHVYSAKAALFFAIAGLLLYIFYVVADVCFGLKAGNLTYRGLVDKGPYRWIRHPMYASKNLAWLLFTIPGINFHWRMAALPVGSGHLSVPFLAANWYLVWPMLAWMSIYALRGITEERYLLAFPEYREYCKRVRYRFIPGLI